MDRPTSIATGTNGRDAAHRPRRPDAAAIDRLPDVVSVHVNTSHWWNNASFALPLLASVVSLAVGLLFGSTEATGFAGFLAAVALLMLPVVTVTWRRTPTAVVLTAHAAIALHSGRVLRELRWDELASIEAADYDNIKWRLRHRDGSHLSVEAELTDIDGLVRRAQELSGLTSSPDGR